MRPYDVAPRPVVDLLAAFHRRDPNWCTWTYADPSMQRSYVTDPDNPQSGYWMHVKPWASGLMRRLWVGREGGPNATDITGFKALGAWAADGPKTFVPTVEQCAALEQVEVNIPLTDYAQPYDALMVKLPPGRYGPFTSCLAYLDRAGGPTWMLSLSLFSPGNKYDIVTVVAAHETAIEKSLLRFDEDCLAAQDVAPKILRVTVNSCLCLVNYGCHARYLFPQERASDERLAVMPENVNGRQAKARDRLLSSPMIVTFSQDIQLHRDERQPREAGEPTGREMPFGWRRGHWAMVACGPNHSERRRTFRRPCMVRADKLLAAGKTPGDTRATYNG